MPGQSVCVEVEIEGNPGIQGATLNISWDTGLTLESAENGKAFEVLNLTLPGRLVSGRNFVWYLQAPIDVSDIADGTILTLNFRVSDEAQEGQKYNVQASYTEGDIFDKNLEPIQAVIENGTVNVVSYMPGDVDSNDRRNAMDLVLLSRYIADGCMTDPDGYNVSINPNAGDVNDDGRLNALDLVLISRYIADGCTTDPDGYNVVLKPSSHDFGHVHSMQETPYKAPTCTEAGNIAYWYCSDCGKYFSNVAGTKEITLEDTVIAALGHTVVVDAAVPATETTKGLTEGSHCSVCHLVLVAQEEYGPLPPNTAHIDYKLANKSKDPYLAQQTINNPNPEVYEIGERLILSNDLTVPGYTFVGWFDSFDESATQIKEIPSTSTQDVTLYAHWKENSYKITYNLYQTPITSAPTDEQKTYTVSKGNSNLYNPEINNYIFLGWYDNNGVEYKTIPVGTTGNIVLNAYYTSQRNLAVSMIDNNPIIVEDNNNHVVYFTYEIGKIRHIPLNGYNNVDRPFWEIQSVAGLSQQVSKTYTRSISKQTANSVSDTISNMTVNSNTWTLSKEWYEEINVNESWANSIGKTTKQCKTEATTSSGTLSVSNQMGGSSYHKTEDGSTVYDYNSKTKTEDKGHQFDASLSGTYANKMSANLGASNEYGTENSYNASNAYTAEGRNKSNSWSASGSESGSSSASDKDKYSAGISYENGYEINAGLKYGYHNNTNTVTKTGSDTVTVNSNIKEDTSSWNNSATFSATNSRSSTETVCNTLSDIVTTTKEYGKSYSNKLTDGETQGFSSTASNTSGTTSTVTYSELESETTTTKYSVDGHIEGKYRCILVGTAHVFGVVGYDYNTKSYFTYTFSVMDDKTEEFLDYTPKGGDFTDCENSCLPFEIPMDIYEYVKDRTAITSGISYRTDSINGTATITSYNGTDTDVIIPSYISDGKQAYKVTEIASSAFAGKPVRVVVLGEFIKSIPDAAFKGCTNLTSVIGSFTEIGAEAFAGCEMLGKMNIPSEELSEMNIPSEELSEMNIPSEKLSEMNIPSNVVKIGKDAFAGVSSINVRAMNALCAYAEAVKVLPDGVDSSDADIEAKRKEITQEFIRSVLECGAQNIAIDLSLIVDGTPLTLEVPEIQSIEISGGSKTYRNFSIKSNAKSTALTEMIINNTNVIPMTVSSDTLTLRKVFVSGNATALILRKDGAILSLIQDSAVQSASKYTVIGNNPVIQSVLSDGAEGFLNVNGSFGYVNSIQGTEHISISNGDLIPITEEEFANYIKGMFVISFDANGGQCDEEQRIITVGNEIGELPVPTREYYTFDGWYTEQEGGERVSADKTFSGSEDVTVYAHWTPTPIAVSIDVSTANASDGYLNMTASASSGTVTWTSSNSAVASVDATGKVMLGTTTGTAIITATASNGVTIGSATKTVTVSNTSGTKFKETSSSSLDTVLYASHPSGYSTNIPVSSSGSIPSYTTNSSDLNNSSYNTSTGRVDTTFSSNGIAGYVYYHYMYNYSGDANNENIIIHYTDGYRNVMGQGNFAYYTQYGCQFFSTTDYPEHDSNIYWTQYYAIWWAAKDKQNGYTWYVANGISGSRAASYYRFPVYSYSKTVSTYTYYYYSIS